MGRHPMRPAHIHFVVSAPGYETLTTHIFEEGDPYLESDAVFGVKDSLVTPFVRVENEKEEANRLFGKDSDVFYRVKFDFKLAADRKT